MTECVHEGLNCCLCRRMQLQLVLVQLRYCPVVLDQVACTRWFSSAPNHARPSHHQFNKVTQIDKHDSREGRLLGARRVLAVPPRWLAGASSGGYELPFGHRYATVVATGQKRRGHLLVLRRLSRALYLGVDPAASYTHQRRLY